MFKKLSIYALAQPVDPAALEAALAEHTFTPAGQAQVVSHGFSPVHDGQLSFYSHGHTLLEFTFEKKVVPGSALKLAVQAKADELEEREGFPPGKMQRRVLKEQAYDDLLARALTSRSTTKIWIDHARGRLLIDSSSNPMCDLIVSRLIRVASLEVTHLDKWPGRLLGDWLVDNDGERPPGYTVDDAVQLQYPGERRTVVTYKKGNLDGLQVQRHIEAGAEVVKMAMTFEDRLSFVMTPAQRLEAIRPLDVLKERQVERDVDRFENDFILMTSELRALVDSLIENA